MGISRAVAAAAIGITGLGLLTACDWDVAKETFSDSEDIGPSFASVRFANDSGNVTIRAGEEASVRREVHYSDEKPGKTYTVRDGVLQLNSCDKPNCWIEYEVTVPAETTVSGQLDSGAANISGVAEVNVRADSGNLDIKDVAGEVNVESDSGSVGIADVGGSVVAKVDSGNFDADRIEGDFTLEASSGAVEARGIGGAAQVESSSGNVVVELTKAADVQVNASSGAVEVTVPQGDYKVVTSADSGNVDSDVANDPSGDHRLDLHTDSGNITVTQA
jgi:DUF4097 and DUF4098 domain-containing protein YvlB